MTGHLFEIPAADAAGWRVRVAEGLEAQAIALDAFLVELANVLDLAERSFGLDEFAAELRAVAGRARTVRNDLQSEARELRAALVE